MNFEASLAKLSIVLTRSWGWMASPMAWLIVARLGKRMELGVASGDHGVSLAGHPPEAMAFTRMWWRLRSRAKFLVKPMSAALEVALSSMPPGRARRLRTDRR